MSASSKKTFALSFLLLSILIIPSVSWASDCSRTINTREGKVIKIEKGLSAVAKDYNVTIISEDSNEKTTFSIDSEAEAIKFFGAVGNIVSVESDDLQFLRPNDGICTTLGAGRVINVKILSAQEENNIAKVNSNVLSENICPQYGKKKIDTESLYCSYHENGRLKEEVPKKEGKKNGFVKYYEEDGMLLGEGVYYDGKHVAGYRPFFESLLESAYDAAVDFISQSATEYVVEKFSK